MEKFKKMISEEPLFFVVTAFFAGLLLGFILSPVKKGMKNTIAIGSYNGANNRFRNSNNVTNDKNKCGKEKCNKE